MCALLYGNNSMTAEREERQAYKYKHLLTNRKLLTHAYFLTSKHFSSKVYLVSGEEGHLDTNLEFFVWRN